MDELVRLELEKNAISRQVTAEYEIWRERQMRKIGEVTPGMEKHYYRVELIEALLKLKRRGPQHG